jgi:hypothetical protein
MYDLEQDDKIRWLFINHAVSLIDLRAYHPSPSSTSRKISDKSK